MSDPQRITLSFRVSDNIAPGENTITLDAYERLMAQCDRTGMSIDEVLDEVITRGLPHPRDDERDDG